MRVLLIEDDPSTAQSVELAFAAEGIICDRTDLGEDGLQIAKLYNYDIIVLDLMLPDIDGYEVLLRLRSAKSQDTYTHFVRSIFFRSKN
jgi:two-component system cell cycle response regulator CtrA